MGFYRRFVNLLRPGQLSRDIRREVDFHIAEHVDELVAGGMSETDARREARRRFGNPEILQERTHDVDVLAWLESLLADLRYAVRALRLRPGFTVVAVLSLGLGIGANTAIFSLIDAVMLRSLPVRDPGDLVQVTMGDDDGSINQYFTNPLWEQIRDRQRSLAGVLAYADHDFDLGTGGVTRHANGAWVSGAYFAVLGVGGAIGRVLAPSDDVRGCPPTAVLSYGFWERAYGHRTDAVGRSVVLDGHPFVIVGVADPAFSGTKVGRSVDVFTPLCTEAIIRGDRSALDRRSTWFLSVLGRRRGGGSLAPVRAELSALAARILAATLPARYGAEERRAYLAQTLGVRAAPNGLSDLRTRYRQALVTLLVVVGVVLVIACANVAQLLLARATARRHEVAVRVAVGAGRARLVRQLLTESLLLAAVGAAVGLLFARWSGGLVVRFLDAGDGSVWLDLSTDWRVFGFTAAVAATAGILFGLAPAWRSTRVAPQEAMRGTGRGTVGTGRHRIAGGIVIGQVALSLVLVTAAGLLVGTFQRLATLDPGFRRDGVLLVHADWTNLNLPEARHRQFPHELLDRLRAVPGVGTGSASLLTPISGSFWNEFVEVDGFVPKDRRDALVWFNGVTDGFLSAMGTRLLSGRDLAASDGPGSPRVVLVNEAMARKFFGAGSPVGKQFRLRQGDSLTPPLEVVGLVQDARYGRLTEDPVPTAYVPLDQTDLWRPSVEIALRADGPPAALITAVTAAVRGVSPAISLQFTTLRDQVSASLARQRLLATLSGFFGGLALLLAVIGLYGTMAYSVARRRSEIGVRIALGAARTGILRLVARDVGWLVAAGLVLGTGLTLAGTRLVAAFLYGVTATDPVTLGLSALTLALVATAAGLIPAWRAARIDPVAALREE